MHESSSNRMEYTLEIDRNERKTDRTQHNTGPHNL